jgi:hypothetical protein
VEGPEWAPRSSPQQVDPETFAFFDALTGKPRVWYWRGKNGEYEFYDNPGYHKRTGEQLAIITPEAIAAWKDAIKQQQQKAAEFAAGQERARQAALEKQQRQAAELAAARERQQKAALEQQQHQAAELAAEQERERQAVTSCDQMAANPSDVRKPGDVAGVPYNELKTNAKAATDACTLAMRVNPEEIRDRYQYARALEIDDPKKALKIHEQLIHDGYLASYDNAGSILIGTFKKIPQAIKYFNEGVRRGDPDSMVSLASLIDQHYVFKNNPAEAKYVLLTRAAELGHPARSSP